MNITDTLRAQGKSVYWHWENDSLPKDELFARAQSADAYLVSCNAVAKTGSLVYIDGTGNRVSALAYGPKRVIVIVGKQKFVNGGITECFSRIKEQACPPNAKRLNLPTPCAINGKCNEQECSSGCMCNYMTVINRTNANREFYIVVMDEEIGY